MHSKSSREGRRALGLKSYVSPPEDQSSNMKVRFNGCSFQWFMLVLTPSLKRHLSKEHRLVDMGFDGPKFTWIGRCVIWNEESCLKLLQS